MRPKFPMPRGVRFSGPWLMIPAGLLAGAWIGRTVALSGPRLPLATGLAALVIPVAWAFTQNRVGRGILAVEAPVLLLLMSTLVFRQRGADALAYNPLDPAAQVRLVCVLLALFLGAVALTSTPADAGGAEGTHTMTAPFRLLTAYTMVVFAGAFLSVNLFLTAYRGVELAAAILVLLGAFRYAGQRATPRIGVLLYWFIIALVISVWVGVLLSPNQAVSHSANRAVPIRVQISGVFPNISANATGAFGVLLAVWSLALSRPASSRWMSVPPWIRRTMLPVGLATALAAQYRTGYVALVVAIIAYLLVERRWGLAAMLFTAVIAALIWYPAVFKSAEPYVLRGTLQQAETLSSRLNYWRAALPVWRESPWLGRGLLTATRFEVLEPLGLPFTSTIHGTWVEALVGTGVIGTTLLAGALLMMLFRAAREALSGGRNVLPLLVLLVLVIRSITSSELSSMSLEITIVLWLALSLRDEASSSRLPSVSKPD